MHLQRLVSRVLFGLTVAAVAASCAASASSTVSPNQSSSGGGFPIGPVPGNSVSAPLPTDAPTSVRNLAPLPSCGAQILFQEDVDISPLPTAPDPVTDASANGQASDCLIAAWQNGLTAELDQSAISDEADEIYSIYRLPGNGTLQLIIRVRSHTDQAVTWTQTTCRQLSLQEGTLTPADCDSETPIA